jgi:hypothetical protein
MRRRSRTRRVLKWVGTAVCALLVATFITSTRCWVSWTIAPDAGLDLVTGGFRYYRYVGAAPPLGTRDGLRFLHRNPGLRVHGGFGLRYLYWRPFVRWDRSVQHVYIPLWIPCLVVGSAAALLWWRDRRLPTGHCQKCGYNLTGNVSGVCPECGTPIEREGKPA